MNLGRAVLIAKINRTPARVIVDGEARTPTEQSTWIRVVLPVTAKERVFDKTIPKAHERPMAPQPPAGGKS
jgi:hypothetical protein